MSTSLDYQALQDKRTMLKARLERIQKDYKSGLSADFSDQAVELENRDVLYEIARVTEEELQRVESLLAEYKTPDS